MGIRLHNNFTLGSTMDELRLYFIHLAQVGDIEVLENVLSILPDLNEGFSNFVSKKAESESNAKNVRL